MGIPCHPCLKLIKDCLTSIKIRKDTIMQFSDILIVAGVCLFAGFFIGALSIGVLANAVRLKEDDAD
jgi:hypothetical protein